MKNKLISDETYAKIAHMTWNELAHEYEALWEGIKSAHLHLLASICECGEPLKDTDAFDVLDGVLTEKETP